MPSFRWTGRTAQGGASITGEIAARSKEEAGERVRAQNIVLQTVSFEL